MQDSAAEMTEVGRMQPTSLLATPEFSSSPTAGKGVGTATLPATFTGPNGDNPRDPSQMGRGWTISAAGRRTLINYNSRPPESILVGIPPPQAPKKPQSRAGWPGFLFMDPVRSIFSDRPTQNVKILQLLPKFSLSLAPTLRRGVTGPHRSPRRGSEGRQLLHYQGKVLQFIL
jgi:hypothetical protein